MANAPTQHKRPPIGKGHAKPKRHAATDKRRGTARERGYTAAWDSFSRSFLQSHPLCEYCLAKGVTSPATVTDHDIPHRGDPDTFWDNTFTALCHPCHNGTKQRLEAKHDGEALLAAVRKMKQL